PRLDRRPRLLDHLVRASIDEGFDGQDAEGEHVQLPDHGYPGREVDRAHDEAKRGQHGRLGSGRHPLVAEQAVGQLGVDRDLPNERADVSERQVHGGGYRVPPLTARGQGLNLRPAWPRRQPSQLVPSSHWAVTWPSPPSGSAATTTGA